MNVKKIKLGRVVLILVLLFVGYKLLNRLWLDDYLKNRKHSQAVASEQKSTPPSKRAVSVNAMLVTPKDFHDQIVVSGTLISNEEVDLRCESSGKVIDIKFQEGAAVKKGDLLLKINDKELQAQYQQALHRKKLAENKENRQRVLLKKDAVSKEEYEISLTELNSLKAEVDLVQAQIERTEIRAPFDGIIGLRNVSLGEYISPSTVVARLVNDDPIKLDFSVPEKYYAEIDLNTAVRFTVEGSEKRYAARIYAIDPKIDLNTRTVQIRAVAPNAERALLPGSFARVQLAVKPLKNAIMIPSEALTSESVGQKIFVYKNGVAEERYVETGIRNEQQVHVLSGLAEGDTLIVSGIMQLRNNAAVKINKLSRKK